MVQKAEAHLKIQAATGKDGNLTIPATLTKNHNPLDSLPRQELGHPRILMGHSYLLPFKSGVCCQRIGFVSKVRCLSTGRKKGPTAQ